MPNVHFIVSLTLPNGNEEDRLTSDSLVSACTAARLLARCNKGQRVTVDRVEDGEREEAATYFITYWGTVNA